MIKILYIIDKMKPAGAQNHLERVISWLDKDSFEVKLVTLKELGVKRIYDLSGIIGLFKLKKLIKREKFDLIFLDLRLPFIGGIQICEIIKSDESLKNTSVILFTASLDNLEERAKECGAQDYLVKPFEPEQLLDKVKKIIG